MHTKRKKLTLPSVYLTFFVDNLSWSIVFPIFAPFFLDPKNLLFSESVSLATRTTLLGIFLAIFPIGQFFGAPLIGEYADKVGRKKAFILTVGFTFLGLVLSAFGIKEKLLWLLLIGRLLSGIFSGNLSICLASIADLSEEGSKRTKGFGYLAMLAGLSFILGTFLGGKFSDSTLNPYFSEVLPFWIAAFCCLFNLFFLLFGFEETHPHNTKQKFHLLESFQNIQQALTIEKLKRIYLIFFLFLFSWNILLQFTPVLAVREFQFTNSEIGDISSFMGVCWAVGAGFLVKKLLRFFSPLKLLETSFLAITIITFSLLFISKVTYLVILLGIGVVLAGVSWPICTNKISEKAGKQTQGKILGMSQSMQSLAMGLSPLVAITTHIHVNIPFLLASLTSLFAAILYIQKKV